MTAHTNVDNTIPHRKIYGFFLRGNSLGGYGFGDLYLDNLQACSLTYPYKKPLGVYAGACVHGVYYACEYTYNSYGPPTAGDFISYDLTTGEKESHWKIRRRQQPTQNPGYDLRLFVRHNVCCGLRKWKFYSLYI